LERFLTQPFFTTEAFTSLKGKLVSLADALDGCEAILGDEFADVPESGLYMIGAISEAKVPPKAKTNTKETAMPKQPEEKAKVAVDDPAQPKETEAADAP
jgi:F-type H+-transporting ATPase subunit beta